MKPEAQKIAIAEACPELFQWVADVRSVYWNKNLEHGRTYVNPLNDLNACHEAEKMLMGMSKIGDTMIEEYEDYLATMWDCSFVFHATAAQRAEAFLKTLNLLKDELS